MTTPLVKPTVIVEPFAKNGSKNTIPQASQIGITPGLASLNDGFPPLTMTAITDGGVPPSGLDFNGILNLITQHTAWVNAGGMFTFDAGISAFIGGYPAGMVLQSNDGMSSYVSAVANNTTDFNSTPGSIGTLWMTYSGKAIGQQVQSNVLSYAADTGAANAYAAAYSPAVTTLTDGMVLEFQAVNANTDASTFAPNGLATKPIIGSAHVALQGGEITAAGKVELMYHAGLASWVLLASTGGAVQVGNALQSQHAVTLAQATALAAAGATTPSQLYFMGQI